MGRWTQYDEVSNRICKLRDDQQDSARLPEGFRRIGYDADTQRYTYRDEEGRIYMGAPGAEYGEL
ncbi:hypothetical protein PLICRDRAFT_82121, partial [Plicaturopsis crispa FD-325 SS-3]